MLANELCEATPDREFVKNSAKLDYDIVCEKSQRNLEIGLVRKWDVA